MIDFELDQFRRNESWRLVLEAYAGRGRPADAPPAFEAESASAAGDGWRPRIQGVEGVKDELLPRIHGKLIALGLLDHQLADRHSGVVYQVSRLGAHALNPAPEGESQDDEAN